MTKRRKHKRRHTNPRGTHARATEVRPPAPPDPAPRETASHETASHETGSHETASHETASHETAPGETAPLEGEPRGRRSAIRPRRRVWRELAPFVGPAAVVVLYAVVRLVYIELSDSGGVLTPSGSVDGVLAALALATFLLRMLTLIVVSFVVVYRLVVRILGPRPRRRTESERGVGER